MSYINIETGEYPVTANDICRQLNASFPEGVEAFNTAVAEFGFAPVQPQPQPHVDHCSNVVEDAPVLKDDTWIQSWRIEPATDDEITTRTDAQAASVRAERNQLLADSDWTQLPDAPVDQAKWAAYRVALRQLKTQPGFPWHINWPQPPNDPETAPANPSRGDTYTASDGTIWVWDQPRNEIGQYIADDPTTSDIESKLQWIRQ